LKGKHRGKPNFLPSVNGKKGRVKRCQEKTQEQWQESWLHRKKAEKASTPSTGDEKNPPKPKKPNKELAEAPSEKGKSRMFGVTATTVVSGGWGRLINVVLESKKGRSVTSGSRRNGQLKIRQREGLGISLKKRERHTEENKGNRTAKTKPP